MAGTLYQDLYGWEVGGAYGIATAGGTDPQMYILDGTAHTGCYYGKSLLRSTGGYIFTRVFAPQISLSPDPTGAGTGFEFKVGVYVRVATYPDQNQTAILALGNGASGLPIDMAIRVNTNGSWEVYNDFAAVATGAGSGTIPLNTWLYTTVTFRWEREMSVAPTLDRVVITTAITGVGTAGITTTFGNLLGSQIRVNRISVGSPGFSGGGTVTIGEVHFDDLVVQLGTITTAASTTPALPGSTRVRLIPITGQGSSAAWTGSYTDLQEIPLDQTGPGQTSTGAGQVTTFTHNTAVQVGIGVIDAVKVYGDAKATISGPTTQQIRLNGTDYPVSITDIYQTGVSTPMALDWTPYPLPTFDAMEYGFVNSTGASLTLGAIHAEVLYTETLTNWFGCGVDPNAPPPGCLVALPTSADSGGGSGCQPTLTGGSDSGGGSGCGVSL